MTSVPFDDVVRQRERYYTLLKYGIAIMLGFCALSSAQFFTAPTTITLLSMLSDVLFTLLLLGFYVLRLRLNITFSLICISVAMMVYGIGNVLVYPQQLLRFINQPLMAVVLVLSYVGKQKLLQLIVLGGVATTVMFWISGYPRFGEDPIGTFLTSSAINILSLIVLAQFHTRVTDLLANANATNTALRHAQSDLERQVAERTAHLQQALDELGVRSAEQARLLAETEQQRATILMLSAPVLPVNDRTLAVPLVGAFDAERLAQLQELVLPAVERAGAEFLVLDVTGVLAVDHEVAQGLLRVAQSAQLMGTQVLLTGIRPEVAQTIVNLGVGLQGLRTAATLQEGIALALRG